jgi:hypothetical protein
MNAQLDWQVVNDDGDWESIAHVGTAPTLRLPGWIWRVAIAILLLLVAGNAIAVRYRFQRAVRQIDFQIQGVIDLEARALAQSDVERYLAQQDASLPGWYAWQSARIGRACRKPDADISGPDAHSLSAQARGCPLAAPARVASVEMRGNVAWVEVITDEGSLRQVRFYRQTDQGWLHTAPHVEFWKKPVELRYGKVLVRAHERDLPYVEPAVAHKVMPGIEVDCVEKVCNDFVNLGQKNRDKTLVR